MAKAKTLEQVYCKDRPAWRLWLSKNHDKVSDSIWLVCYKKPSTKPSLQYDESVGEALCFGWIESIIRRIDEESYCRKFAPR